MNINFSKSGNFGTSSGSGSQLKYKYVYDLPFLERKELCRILDENNDWETLGGGFMGYRSSDLSEFGKGVYRNASPTDILLTAWGSQNHTILELFVLLGKMKHFRGMRLLANHVDPKYHVYIRDPDGNVNVTMELVQLNEAEKRAEPKSPDAKKDDKKNVAPDDTKKVAQAVANAYGALPQIPYEQLVAATNNWDRRYVLGKGGFGTVFKGQWKSTEVAIKRMEQRPNRENAESQMKQSLGELKFLNSYRHDNVLPLYGFSLEGDHPCLVYQFMPNGSLEDRLLCRQRTPPLDWMLRYRIARGVACGLQFLHSITEKPLIHGDIKSANILLDKNFEPKVGDFGLARETEMNVGASYVKVSRVHGTRPYLPDEYLRSKKLSPKVDTFSFGIVLFEIATGQRAYEDARPKKFLKDMIEDTEQVELLRDPRGGQDFADVFHRLVSIGKHCTRRLPRERPAMVDVLKTLDTSHLSNVFRSTMSTHVTGIQRLFNPSTNPSLMPTMTNSIPRLSPEIPRPSDMRVGSPVAPSHHIPLSQHQFFPSHGHHPLVNYPVAIGPSRQHQIDPELPGSSPRRSPSVPSPTPPNMTTPLTISDNNQQAGNQINILMTPPEKDAVSNPVIPQFVGFLPPQKLQPLQPQPRFPVPAVITDDDHLPLVLPTDKSGANEGTECDQEKCNDFGCSQGPATVIPLITELGIKDTDEDCNDDES